MSSYMIYPLKIRYVMGCIDLTITLGCMCYHYFLSQICMLICFAWTHSFSTANSCFWKGLMLLIWWFAYCSCMSQVVCNYCICMCAEFFSLSSMLPLDALLYTHYMSTDIATDLPRFIILPIPPNDDHHNEKL